MLRQVALPCAVLLLMLIHDSYTQTCFADENFPCLDEDMEETKANCESARFVENCCWMTNINDGKGGCRAKISGNARSSNKKRIEDAAKEGRLAHGFDPNVDESKLRQMASTVQASKDEGVKDADVKQVQRSLSGLGGINPLAAFLGAKSIFPECPVDVKYCYRVPCGGYNRPDLQTNPRACLSNPLCCFDYTTAFYKNLFGSRFLGNAPSCYYGATSKQWRYVTQSFRPWNPFFTSFILKTFKSIFKTNVFNIGNKFACDIDIQSRAYPVGEGSELQCNLVSGCWKEDAEPGSQCQMPASIFSGFFGRQEDYPSLYTNDPSDTQCSANWFDYGPKAYNRLPCGIGPPPPGLVDKIFNWCPYTDCCLNYASALSGGGISDLLILSQIGGGGGGGIGGGLGGLFGSLGGLTGGFSPTGMGSTPFNSQAIQYLFLANQDSSSSTDFSTLFCPYRFALTSSLFRDLAKYAIGCCDIPDCYHKKKLVGGGFRPNPPQPPRPQPSGRWGDWSDCRVPCGQQGTQYRQCFYGNSPAPGRCSGSDTRPCQGACTSFGTWGQWQQGQCNRPCGPGTAQFTRSCFYNGQVVSPQSCSGPPTKTDSCVNNPPCQSYRWGGQFRIVQSCTVTCGQGTERYQAIDCVDDSGNRVPRGFCQGAAPIETRPCTRRPCQERAMWTDWADSGPCGASCGDRGLKQQTRRCVFPDGRDASMQLCGGRGVSDVRRLEPCRAPPCVQRPYVAGECNRDQYGRCYITYRCYTLIGNTYREITQGCNYPRVDDPTCSQCRDY